MKSLVTTFGKGMIMTAKVGIRLLLISFAESLVFIDVKNLIPCFLIFGNT